jgi:hypothetical protein
MGLVGRFHQCQALRTSVAESIPFNAIISPGLPTLDFSPGLPTLDLQQRLQTYHGRFFVFHPAKMKNLEQPVRQQETDPPRFLCGDFTC